MTNTTKTWIALAPLLFSVMGCDVGSGSRIFKKSDAQHMGIDFRNTLSPDDDLNIIDYLYFYNGGGVALGDTDGDGLLDIFMSGNQVPNRLYRNKGNGEFEDVTEKAGVAGGNSWDTGSLMGDINGDGLLDIYVCAVVGLKNLAGHNELFINNGDGTFSERAREFGLDFESYSSTAALLDYDLDGDVDMFLLNHAVHTSESFGHASLRNVRTYESGGKLLRNDGNRFVDVSEEAGIYGGANGYGLGVAIADFNSDGYPDIYVGNDFHEDDYYYINNGNGTFHERGKELLTFTSKFSMGSDAADINHDGFIDLITLDMMPEDERILKRSVDDENVNLLRMRVNKYGYNYQFPRNMLQVNLGDGRFAETALMSGVAATDWSWSALFADFDQDGHQDLFVSNGIERRPNDLDYIKFVSSEQIVDVIGTTRLMDEKALAMMPSGKVRNYVFKGSGGYAFEDMSASWLPDEMTCSTASAYGDLDGDGDLDLVINNVNDAPSIYINRTDSRAGFLRIALKGPGSNSFGIGARVYSYHGGLMQLKEMYTARGFQSSSEPVIHFGYGDAEEIDSLKVVWPDGKVQTLKGIRTGQTVSVLHENARVPYPPRERANAFIFRQVPADSIGLGFVHTEDSYTDFDRLKLLPYQQSDRGPATAIGDLDNDGEADVYFGGSKHFPPQFFFQRQGRFVKGDIEVVSRDSVKEDVDAVIRDFNDDGRADLFVGTGGADFYRKAKQLLDNYYSSGKDSLSLTEIADYYENASCVRAADYDQDGDLDLFVGNESVSDDFGKVPRSYLLRNDKGNFTPVYASLFNSLGMVTDAVWSDYNSDGQLDLVAVGEWMDPVFLRQSKDGFERDQAGPGKLSGLWQSVCAFDIDGDSDPDYVLGNWGLNSRFKSSAKYPMLMYYGDFDKNGKSETLLAIEKAGKYYPLEGFDLIAAQLPGLRKQFTTYESFAGKTMAEIFTENQLGAARVYDVHELASGYLRNDGGRFTFVRLPLDAQTAPITAMVSADFDDDGVQEVVMGGNYFGVQPFHGRFGSFQGGLLRRGGQFLNGADIGLNFLDFSVRHLNVITLNMQRYLLVTINNDACQLFKIGK